MGLKKIENAIVKYFSQSADINDLDMLNNWLAEEKNHEIFKSYVQTHFAINVAMNDSKIDKVRDELLKEIHNEKKAAHKTILLNVFKYAAIAIVFLGLGFLVNDNLFTEKTSNVVSPREDVITLELGNGQKQVIREDDSMTIVDADGNVVGNKDDSKIIYDSHADPTPEYNTLSIPKGKRFGVVLSDGTKVHLNAGSSITYPTFFQKNKPRKVILKGEAFFEVSKNVNQQFVVNVQDLDVKVYGTKFNVSNYTEDRETKVVLVEGSVSLSNLMEVGADKEFYLKPGYLGVFDKEEGAIADKKVNTDIYTSWMNGNLIFRDESFKNIIKKLERHYNVVIINNNRELDTEKFNATVEMEHETIEQVFKYFNKVYKIEYQIVENKIIIN
ncbi:FecR family protein [Maribacter sp. MMG018]|uniref:FecR family protein n=1 Tax=Maribacter sp. MMG018 TaxID=2822688 RepID=UPI001B386B4B|nr:FecR family protein [Maribacter sp. MMG018]MBQ4915304.1 FecR family protein [Maribacter sp. MMG018]